MVWHIAQSKLRHEQMPGQNASGETQSFDSNWPACTHQACEMKKFLIAAVIVVALALGGGAIVLPMFGMSATDLVANVRVGTGMGAKLACSGRYLSGLDERQVASDLSSYTPATDTLSIRYDDELRSVTASLMGMATTTAKYREGLGCSLDIGDTAPLDALRAPPRPATTGEWPLGEVANGLSAPLQTKVEEMLAADNAAGLQTRALVVAHEGNLVAEAYAPGFDPSSKLLGWSMGKSLTAIMLGHMEMLQQLSVQETGLFPRWQADQRGQISIENMLQMASGLDFSEVYAPGSDATAMLFTAHSASEVALSSDLAHPPGDHFYYSSGTTNMLARLLTDRLGGSQAAIDFLVNNIFNPLGMRHMVVEVDPSGVFVGSSYVYGSGRDWARLGQLMLNGGELNGVRVVTEDWVSRARAPNSSSNDSRYGYQFWLNDGNSEDSGHLRWSTLPADAYAMSGNRAQTVMIIPSAQAVLVRLGWTSGHYPMVQNFTELLGVLANY